MKIIIEISRLNSELITDDMAERIRDEVIERIQFGYVSGEWNVYDSENELTERGYFKTSIEGEL